MYRAWLVDLDGTLYWSLPVQIAMSIQLCFARSADRRSILEFRATHERLRLQGTSHDPSPFWTQLTQAAAANAISEDEMRRLVDEWMIERPLRWIALARRRRLLAEIASFRAAGGRTAIVSDYPARRKLESLGILLDFDAIVANGEPGGPSRLKPDPGGYLLAAARLDVPPESCLVIGDRKDSDGEAARRANMAFRPIRLFDRGSGR